jgi:hypothetical protein
MITLFLLFFLTYCIGFVAGYLLNRKEAEMLVEGIVEQGKKLLPDNRLKPGIIRRPTAQDLEKRNVPEKVKQGHEAMMETLDKIPELQKMRKELNEHRKLEV